MSPWESVPTKIVRTCPVSCGWVICAGDFSGIPGFVPIDRDEEAFRDVLVAEHVAAEHPAKATR